MYAGVPIDVPTRVNVVGAALVGDPSLSVPTVRATSSAFAIPKSATEAALPESRTLSGFMSR
jgi:hypothetical protein